MRNTTIVLVFFASFVFANLDDNVTHSNIVADKNSTNFENFFKKDSNNTLKMETIKIPTH